MPAGIFMAKDIGKRRKREGCMKKWFRQEEKDYFHIPELERQRNLLTGCEEKDWVVTAKMGTYFVFCKRVFNDIVEW